MDGLNRIINRFTVRGFLVNSVPKAGTNLLAKALLLMPGISRVNINFGDLMQKTSELGKDVDTVIYGVDWQRKILLAKLENAFNKIRYGHFSTCHIPYSEKMAELLKRRKMKLLLMLRDPRDVVVSHANHVYRRPDHFLYAAYQNLSEFERIMTSITGTGFVEQAGSDKPSLLNINERFRSVISWSKHPSTYTTYFERLVGPKGNGSFDSQIQELTNISRHLGLWCSSKEIQNIAEQLFGGTNTFRRGIISSWRHNFSRDHIREFNNIAGQLLVDLGFE